VILGHLTVTAAVHREARRVWPSLPLGAGALLFGAYLPDLLDKPIELVSGLSGRGYGHSIVVQGVVLGLALMCLRRHRAVVGTIALGAAIHLVEDWVEARVLLAPLLGAVPFRPPRDFLESLRRYYTSASVFVGLEAAATVYWLGVAVARLVRRRHTSPAPENRPVAVDEL
jgi:hypothetical protein